MPKRAIKWSGVADYVESGLLIAVVMDGDSETDDTAEMRLTELFPDWDSMAEISRYAAGNGVKQICADGATTGTPAEKCAAIRAKWARLLDGEMPGSNRGPRVSYADMLAAVAELLELPDTDESVVAKARELYEKRVAEKRAA